MNSNSVGQHAGQHAPLADSAEHAAIERCDMQHVPEICEQLKQEGNSCVKISKYTQAIEAYSRAIESACANMKAAEIGSAAASPVCGVAATNTPPRKSGASLKTTETLSNLVGQCHANRALCHLKLNEFQAALADCDIALKHISGYDKAMFRRALAHEGLGNREQAVKDLQCCLKADPSNRQAAKKLLDYRDTLCKAQDQILSQNLPSRLIGVAIKPEESLEKRVEAVRKLGSFGVHREQRARLLKDNVVGMISDVIVNEKTPMLWDACWELLHSLVTDQDNEEDINACDKRSHFAALRVGKPLRCCETTEEGRKAVRARWSCSQIYEQVKMMLRAGAKDPGVVSAERTDKQSRGSAVSHALVVLANLEVHDGISFEHDASFLDTINLGLQCMESPYVRRSALNSVALVADARRRLGKKVKAVNVRHGLSKCLETTLSLVSEPDIRQTAEFVLVSIIHLLADKDRAPQDTVNMEGVLEGLLRDYFLQSSDPANWKVGLIGLKCVFTADRDSARVCVLGGGILDFLLTAAGRTVGEDREIQQLAAECLMQTMEFPELRHKVVESDGINVLLNLCTQLQGTPVRAKIAATLARLCVHNEDVRDIVFSEFDFFKTLEDVFKSVKIDTNVGAKEENADVLLSLMEILFFLGVHGTFKLRLLDAKTDGIIQQIRCLGDAVAKQDVSPIARYMFCGTINSLLRSREDKEDLKKRSKMPYDLDETQLEQLRLLYEKLPAMAKPVENGQVDAGDVEVAAGLRQRLLDVGIVQQLCKAVCITPLPSLNVLSSVAMSIKLLCKEPKNRGLIIRQGGLRALLTAAAALKEYPQDQRDAHQALAQLCISMNPKLFAYQEALDVTPHLVKLLRDQHELYQFEAALALTNLTSLNEDVRTRVWHAKGWSAFIDLLFIENPLLRAAGLEGLCNMSMSPSVHEHFSKASPDNQDFRLLFAFSNDSENPRAQKAATGALAMLAEDSTIAALLLKTPNFWSILQGCKESNDSEILVRVFAFFLAALQCESCDSTSREKMIMAVKSKNSLTGQAAEVAKQVLNLM
eukprot:GHVT01044058.1.p1 GENE.GHVT01044058.1~~GHVT01044058.1.p1  ORF type:complete len:1046 (+),score=102.53 GHVT01044058.1:153-3290(+)